MNLEKKIHIWTETLLSFSCKNASHFYKFIRIKKIKITINEENYA